MASHQTLPERSRDWNGWLPHDVADRVDRPGDVVDQRDADQPGPEERGQRAPPRPGEQAAEQGGEQQRAARRTSGNIREIRARCRGPRAGRGRTWPARSARRRTASPCGRSSRPLVSAQVAVAVPPRGVRVALAVAERVVLAVVGDPADQRALDGERPGDGQGDPQRPVGLERRRG